MARRVRQTPVFYEPQPARWPWMLLVVLIVGIAAYGFFIRPDLPPFIDLRELAGLQVRAGSSGAGPARRFVRACRDVPFDHRNAWALCMLSHVGIDSGSRAAAKSNSFGTSGAAYFRRLNEPVQVDVRAGL